MAAPIKPPPIVRKDPWDFRQSLWQGAGLRRPSSGSAAKDVFRNLPSKFDPPPQRDLPKEKK
jgi:hypothetical protein